MSGPGHGSSRAGTWRAGAADAPRNRGEAGQWPRILHSGELCCSAAARDNQGSVSIHVALESRHRTTGTTGRSRCRRRSCACGRRRTAARRSCRTRCASRRPAHFINWQQDPQSNYLARLDVSRDRSREFRVEVDLVAEMAVYNPFDFFLEPDAEHFPFSYDDVAAAASCSRSCDAEPLTPRFARYLAGDRRAAAGGRSTSWSSSTSGCSSDIGYVIRLEPGVQTPRRRSTLGSGSCRDTLAARAAAAPPRARRAVRLRLPDPAHARREGARRSGRRRAATSPTCTPGARSTCPAPAGSGSTRRRACSPAKGTSRWRARPSRRAPRRSPAASTTCEVEFDHEMTVQRIHESPRVTKPYTDDAVGGDRRARPRGRCRPRRAATCA